MDVVEQRVLQAVSVALTAGQGEFTDEDLAAAYEEVQRCLVMGSLASFVLEANVTLTIKDGTVLFGPKPGAEAPVDEPRPLEELIMTWRPFGAI